jgi:integrase
MTRNPAKLPGRNPEPPRRAVRVYSVPEEEAIAAELSPMYEPLPDFAAATGLRPEEGAALKRRDVDRGAALISVRRIVSDGEVVELAKTSA